MNRRLAISPQQSQLFLVLIAAQACHSVEEYAFRIYDVFLPARLLVGLFSDDPRRGFIILNVAFVAFGLWCYLFPIRRGWPAAIPLLWLWAVVETVNGIVHPAVSVAAGGYTPGLVTSLALLPLGVSIVRRLTREGKPPAHRPDANAPILR